MAGNPGRFQFELVLSGLAQYVLNLRQFLVPARREFSRRCPAMIRMFLI